MNFLRQRLPNLGAWASHGVITIQAGNALKEKQRAKVISAHTLEITSRYPFLRIETGPPLSSNATDIDM